jgi:hypothetical protein
MAMAARLMATARKRARGRRGLTTATIVVGDKEEDGDGSKSDVNGDKVGKGKGVKRDGNGDKEGKGKGGTRDGDGN